MKLDFLSLPRSRRAARAGRWNADGKMPTPTLCQLGHALISEGRRRDDDMKKKRETQDGAK